MQNRCVSSYFIDYLIQSEIDDFYKDLKEIENFNSRESFRNNKYLFTLPINEAINKVIDIKIKDK